MTFNEKLVKLRKIKGLTQDEMASAVRVSRQAVYKWESGQSYPEAMTLVALKELLGISIDDLLDESYEVIVPEKKKKRTQKAKAAAVEAAEEIAPEAPVAEEAPVVAEAPAIEEVKEEAKPEEKPVETAPEAEPEKKEEAPKKKVGFFGRLFGRK